MSYQYDFLTSFREDQDIRVRFNVANAEPDVGIMSAYVDDLDVVDYGTGQSIEVTDDEVDALCEECMQHAQDDADYEASEHADRQRDSAWDRW